MLAKNWGKTLKTLALDNSGVTIVEFAIIAPVCILILFGIIEFSLIMFVSASMEGAADASARYGKTGYIASGSTRQQQIAATIATRTAGLLEPTKITVTTTIYPSFDSVNQPEPYTDSNNNSTYNIGEPYTDINNNGQWDLDMGVAGLGNANDIVVYTISYPWNVNTPLISYFLGGTLNISSRSVVKNEPF